MNLSKNKLFGLNLASAFLQAAASFLSCGFGLLLLSIPIGINPRRKDSWTHIFVKLKRRLAVWHNILLSIGGRVVLLNSVLTNISIFFLSFYKAPKVIINKIISIQIYF